MWNTIQCAVQGRGHIKSDIPCQDKTYTYSNGDVTAIALADGAGSAKLSHYGAEGITKFICKYMVEGFDTYFSEKDGAAFKRKIVNDLDDELNKLADIYKCKKKELASTLLVAVVNANQYILLHIGDGVIGYLKDNQLLVASQPENGEFANTTVFTTSRDVLQTMKIIKGNLGCIEGFVLMSDGTEASLYDKRKCLLAPVLKRIMKYSQIISKECLEYQLLDSFENVIRGATIDDCSIAILMKDNKEFYGYRNLDNIGKEQLLGLKENSIDRKTMNRYDTLLECMCKPSNMAMLGRAIHLKPKYTKKYIEVLLSNNLIISKGGWYKTAVKMEK
ncbi:MAG: PP2C family serine/threonine-protein phosphatase [Intestinibacter sp.]|uniref:PP2C family serine/threonine-protein phosphatase n=1 Tax=Intestinibacter sp. TaxID=1965304 RepID=UPI002A7EE978|nr:PP2C family serine/threonine-protein phosphatase [Intestinibacter sp.]MDY4573988.1 PP2C family serine/threonine-protein phosphatase [Intestinibacter sp.]